MRKLFRIIFLLICPLTIYGQGLNNTWLLGSGWLFSDPKGRMVIDDTSYYFQQEYRDMPFLGTEATISDQQGNFLMSSNGVWIANANNDTMMNGSGLNPGYFANSWYHGLPIEYGNIILPSPGDSNKYTLIHQTELDPNSSYQGIYKTKVDITLDNGLGAVVSKNDTILLDSLSWGIGACKHANGRDWWIVFMKDSSDIIYKCLLTPNGISNISTQALGFYPHTFANASQLTFSQDGLKLLYSTYDNPVSRNCSVVIMDFDRCSGLLSNTQTLLVSAGNYLWGLAFSPSSQFAYTCNSGYVFQINTSSLTIDTVAMYDGFISGFPPNCCATTFWNMYLAANGKIYITSGSSVKHIHEMNFPDSAGIMCDVQQHAINLGILNFRSVPNHPNYNLGPLIGSPCDTLGVGITEINYNFHFSISPNPNNGNFKISYLLPQNKAGIFNVYDINGKIIYQLHLPQWSSLQNINLPANISNGVYGYSILSDGKRVTGKIAVIANN